MPKEEKAKGTSPLGDAATLPLSEDEQAQREEIIEKVLFPELAEDKFTVEGKTFKLRQMPFLYEKRIKKMIGPMLDRIAKAGEDNVMEFLVSEAFEALPEFTAIICQMTDEKITKEWVEKNMNTAEMLAVVKRQLELNHMMDMVTGFFRRLLAGEVKGAMGFLSMLS